MIKQYHKMPRMANVLFDFFLPEMDCRYLMGDYEEIYSEIVSENGKWVANFWIMKQILKMFPLYLIDSIYWRCIMFKNYLNITFRNIFKHKGYSFINVVGLALGMACCLFIMLWVMDEMSYNRFHENIETLYRVEQDQFYSGETYHVTVTPIPMGPGIKEEIPEITDATRYTSPGTLLLRYGEKAFFESGTRAVDPSFLKMMTFPLILGDPNTALDQPHSFIISEDIADKYFADEDPLGKAITVNNQYQFTVTGVMKNVPNNSNLGFEILVPFEFLRDLGRTMDRWGNNSILTLVQLHESASIPEVNQKITDIRHRHVAEFVQQNFPEDLQQFNERRRTEFMVMPLKDIHLYGYFGYTRQMNIQYVYIVSVIALFVLLIACINFMNLATARSANRAKEVGLRKVVGAMKRHLVGQFYGESILLAFIALVFALGLCMLLIGSFNMLSGKEFSRTAFFNWKFVLGMISVALITGLVSGSYPALFLSAFQPVKVLKGALTAGSKSALFRKILVVTQFSLSILLIISTAFVYRQLIFMQSKKLGYDKEQTIYIPLRGNTRESYAPLKEALKRDPRVVNVAGTGHPPTNIGSNSGGADWDGKDPEMTVLISQNRVDFDYIETMKMEMAGGRSFSKDFSTDTSTAFIINEELQRIMGEESAVNKRLEFMGVDGTIVGVVKNFHFQSVRYEIEPLAFRVRPESVNYMVIRLPAGSMEESIDFVKSTWERIIPNYPFDHYFVDEAYDRMYRGEARLSNLLRAFAILAVVIACLGLFGLASFTAEQRTKEIGVRKVLGASAPGIVFLLSKEFTKWVVVANIIAWPVAYLVLRKWLQDFAYRTELVWWVFVGSGVLALVVALLTVSFQAIRSAFTNPADALRYE